MAITCRECTDQYAASESDLLSDDEVDVVAEHVDSCPRCQVFNDQLDETVQLLELLPLAETTPTVADLVNGQLTGDDLAVTLQRLCRLAASLDPQHADDLVQDALLAALQESPARLGLSALSQRLTDGFIGSADSRTVSSFGQSIPVADPDSETGELFYPEFYEDGPDAGRFVDQPNTWGLVPVLDPSDDVVTGELFDVVERALIDLPAPDRQLVELIDVGGLSFGEAAESLRLDNAESARALARGRMHVRGALDRYVTGP